MPRRNALGRGRPFARNPRTISYESPDQSGTEESSGHRPETDVERESTEREAEQEVNEESPESEETFDDVDRALVQAFLARPSATEQESISTLQQITTIANGSSDDTLSPEDLRARIAKINDGLEVLNLQIVTTRDQMVPTRVYYTLINISSNAVTKLATQYTVDEIEFFKAMMDFIFIEGNPSGKQHYRVQHADLAKCDAKLERRLGSGPREQLVMRLLDEQWLVKSPESESLQHAIGYELGPRSLAELKNYLTDLYGPEGSSTLRFCRACNGIFTKGRRCSTSTCGFELHESCTRAFFMGQGRTHCPNCSVDLHVHFTRVGEE